MGSISSDLESSDDENITQVAKVYNINTAFDITDNPTQQLLQKKEVTKQIHVKDDQLLKAYIHDIDISILSEQYIIPQIIIDLCFLYYHLPLDNFESAGYKIKIIGKKRTKIQNISYFGGHLSGYINSYKYYYQTAYGSEIIIPSLNKIYKWEYKILSDYCLGSIYIGIDSLDAQHQHTVFAGNTDSFNYSLCSNGKKYSHELDRVYGQVFGKGFSAPSGAAYSRYRSSGYRPPQDGSIITMTLDFTKDKGVLRFDDKVAFHQIPGNVTKYKSAIALFCESSVELISYTQE